MVQIQSSDGDKVNGPVYRERSARAGRSSKENSTADNQFGHFSIDVVSYQNSIPSHTLNNVPPPLVRHSTLIERLDGGPSSGAEGCRCHNGVSIVTKGAIVHEVLTDSGHT